MVEHREEVSSLDLRCRLFNSEMRVVSSDEEETASTSTPTFDTKKREVAEYAAQKVMKGESEDDYVNTSNLQWQIELSGDVYFLSSPQGDRDSTRQRLRLRPFEHQVAGHRFQGTLSFLLGQLSEHEVWDAWN